MTRDPTVSESQTEFDLHKAANRIIEHDDKELITVGTLSLLVFFELLALEFHFSQVFRLILGKIELVSNLVS
jgi:hypothetical protein